MKSHWKTERYHKNTDPRNTSEYAERGRTNGRWKQFSRVYVIQNALDPITQGIDRKKQADNEIGKDTAG